MSKRSNKPISQGTQASTTRTPWLGLALVVLAAVAVISIVVWMAQQSTANALTATTPALSAVATNATDAAPAPATATSFTAADGVTALPADGPRIAVEQTLFDYGDVRFNTPIETVVRVSNVGSEVLAIAQNPRVELVEGCWPPQAVVGSTTLQPGEETEVKVRFTMHAGMDGQHEFRVHIVSNDPVEPDKQVVILSNWVP